MFWKRSKRGHLCHMWNTNIKSRRTQISPRMQPWIPYSGSFATIHTLSHVTKTSSMTYSEQKAPMTISRNGRVTDFHMISHFINSKLPTSHFEFSSYHDSNLWENSARKQKNKTSNARSLPCYILVWRGSHLLPGNWSEAIHSPPAKSHIIYSPIMSQQQSQMQNDQSGSCPLQYIIMLFIMVIFL